MQRAADRPMRTRELVYDPLVSISLRRLYVPFAILSVETVRKDEGRSSMTRAKGCSPVTQASMQMRETICIRGRSRVLARESARQRLQGRILRDNNGMIIVNRNEIIILNTCC